MPDRTPIRPLPSFLTNRYRAWRDTKFEEDRAWYARLAEEGQRPRAMVIGCCDSRVDVARLFSEQPGEIFVVRNVASVVPPFEPAHSHHGTSAAIEYAVTVLHVTNVVVLGHSHCGGIAACDAMCSAPEGEGPAADSFIGRWMKLLRPAYDLVADIQPREARLQRLEQQGVRISLLNLWSYPFVREAVERGELALHGAWIDIATGALSYAQRDGSFDLV